MLCLLSIEETSVVVWCAVLNIGKPAVKETWACTWIIVTVMLPFQLLPLPVVRVL